MKWDLGCFYIDLQQKAGHPYHTSHPTVLNPTLKPLPTRLLTSDQIKEILHVVKSTSNNGSAQNYLHGKFGKFVNIIKIAYWHWREQGHLLTTNDDIHHMMENFELYNKISFISLFDVPVKEFFDLTENSSPKSLTNQDNANKTLTTNDTVTVSTVKDFSGKIEYREMNEQSGIVCLANQIQDERRKRNLTKDNDLFIAIA